MRPHPWIVTLALLLVGVIAFDTTLISRHREARRLRRLPLPAEPEPAPPPRLRWFPPPSAALPPRPEPVAPAPALPTGVLRISVTGPHGLRLGDVTAYAVRQGDLDQAHNDFEEAEGDEGTLAATDLPPGRYDIFVEAPRMQPARVEGVPPGGEAVPIAMARAAMLQGIARRSAGERGCARSVFISREGGGFGTSVDQEDCTFEIYGLPQGATFEMRATGPGFDARSILTVPLTGDPPFACIGAPCDEPRATLAIYVAGERGTEVEAVSVEWTLVGDPTRGEFGNTTASGLTYLHGRRPGETLHLRASDGESSAETTVVVGAGVTDAVLTLPAAARNL